MNCLNCAISLLHASKNKPSGEPKATAMAQINTTTLTTFIVKVLEKCSEAHDSQLVELSQPLHEYQHP